MRTSRKPGTPRACVLGRGASDAARRHPKAACTVESRSFRRLRVGMRPTGVIRPRPYDQTMPLLRLLIAPLLLGLALVAASPAQAAAASTTTVRVYHQAVTPIATSGSGIGMVRTFFIPIAVDGKSGDGQYLTGTLTTLAEGMPGGQELRGSNLTFVFGSEENQLVVGGISYYPSAGATLAPGQKTTRPLLGGSGIYEGARGQVVSTNLGPAGWTHVFRVTMN